MSERLARQPRLSGRTRSFVLFLATIAMLVFLNSQILIKEDIMENGQTVLLQLAPKDPRSLLQGDYMALRYAMADEVADAARAGGVTDGRVVVNVAENGVADFAGLYVGQSLGANQHRLRFRKRGETVRLASDAYFFEEGQWRNYANARFGEVRVSEAGDAVLIALRDRDGNRLGEALQ